MKLTPQESRQLTKDKLGTTVVLVDGVSDGYQFQCYAKMEISHETFARNCDKYDFHKSLLEIIRRLAYEEQPRNSLRRAVMSLSENGDAVIDCIFGVAEAVVVKK